MKRRTILFAGVCLAGAVWLAGAQASAQSPEDALRLSLYLTLGAGGETALDTGAITLRADNRAWVGGGARLEKPVLQYLSLGLMVELFSYDVERSDRDIGSHIDLWIKPRVLITTVNGLALEGYLGLGVGFTVLSATDPSDLRGDAPWLGWNMGLLLGAQLFVTERGAVLVELGWRRVQVFNEAGSVDLVTTTNQVGINLGWTMMF